MIELNKNIIEALINLEEHMTDELQESIEEVIECCLDRIVATEDERSLRELAWKARASLSLLREYVDFACDTIEP